MSDEQMNEMAEAFLRWSLPEDVCADAIACTPRAPHRTGTNLLTARQAVEMIKFVCGPELAVMHAEARDAKARIAELEAERDDLLCWKEDAVTLDARLIDAEARVERAEAYAARMDALVTAARDLLAVIHRDGGHHCEAFGFPQAAEDAQRVVIELRAELAAAKVDAAIGAILRRRLVSSNGVPVSRAHVTADEVAAIDAARGGEG